MKRITKPIQTSSQIDLQSHLIPTVLIFNQTQIQKVASILNHQVAEAIDPIMTKCKERVWISKRCNKQQQLQVEEIERLIGLNLNVICFQLSTLVEGIIEKIHNNIVLHYLSIESTIATSKLIFVKTRHLDGIHTSLVNYYCTLQEALQLAPKQDISVSSLQLHNLVQIFSCELPQNIPKMIITLRRYVQIRKKEVEVQKIQQEIFKRNFDFIFQDFISKDQSKKDKKLIWKLERTIHLREWIKQQKNSMQVDQSNLTFANLPFKITSYSLNKYHFIWTLNSVMKLKTIFKKANIKDQTNFFKQFVVEYQIMKENLSKIELQMVPSSYRSKLLIQAMRIELKEFYDYHYKLLQGKAYRLTNLKKECKFLWRYNKRFINIIGAFIILLGFAYLQGSMISIGTILLVGTIATALRY